MKYLRFFIAFILSLPVVLLIFLSGKRETVKLDLLRWRQTMHLNGFIQCFYFLMTYYPEFRSVLYYRLGLMGNIFGILLPKKTTLYIETAEIGPGLFIQHGFSTIISCESIGANCWINQQVTLGFDSKGGRPILKDNIIISAGAKVFGAITIGSNSIVGANAVVTKNVPDNCIVVGIPAYIIKKDGKKVNLPL